MAAVKTAHEMKIELLNVNRQTIKALGVTNFNINDQGCRHALRALGRMMAHLAIDAGVPPQAAVGLVIEGIQNALEHKDETVETALGSMPLGDA